MNRSNAFIIASIIYRIGDMMPDQDILSRLQQFLPDMKHRQDEAIEKLRLLFEEHLKKPLDEQLKMAREAMEYGSSKSSS